MNYDDTPVQHSATERQFAAPGHARDRGLPPDKCLDVIHEFDLDLLWGRQE